MNAASSENVLTVAQLNNLAKDCLESMPFLQNVCVRGELSNVTLHRTGHIYFSIKDKDAAISATMWKSDAQYLGFTPENGQEVTARGKVTLWVQRGQYTFNARTLTKTGTGDLLVKFEELKKKLEAEGLFDPARKRKLPKYPKTIGVITAATGAAVRDIINVTGRRFPLAKILVCPSLVQGDGAPAMLIRSLEILNRVDNPPDVIIIGRGGGSTEDLWAFNDENLARAVAASNIPVISAVGHETDFTICDFAADVRMPTPSAAAEFAVPDKEETKRRLANVIAAMKKPLIDKITAESRVLSALAENKVLTDPLASFDQRDMALTALDDRLCMLFSKRIESEESRLSTLSGRLEALNPLSVLSRGFAAVFDEKGELVKNAADTFAGQNMKIKFADGEINAERK